ncbi:hypothetical protein CDAR_67361 [Caerostris darwini]|uniref:Uncharacterized protein n=1 Tax=Caerostris darwini TaxID=1538125 RepID=A0AAV4U8I3_9ARAC|nr:hypothetical protein CDAR_67361 [Caerostris darwini]
MRTLQRLERGKIELCLYCTSPPDLMKGFNSHCLIESYGHCSNPNASSAIWTLTRNYAFVCSHVSASLQSSFQSSWALFGRGNLPRDLVWYINSVVYSKQAASLSKY